MPSLLAEALPIAVLNLSSLCWLASVCPLVQSHSQAVAQNGSSLPWEGNPLLPPDVKPESYNLHLNPDINNGLFTGNVSVALNVTQKRDHILVHSKDLDITRSEIVDCRNGKPLDIKEAFEYKPNEFWVIVLEKEIIPGRYVLNLEFGGSLVNKIVGFYRSQYVNPDNQTRYLVTTKFEPTYARRAFPCFDEPAYKAVFNVELVRPSEEGYVALSNMQQVEEIPDTPSSNWTLVKFAPTPPMSTYLACFIVCDFEKLDTAYSQRGTHISVYARPGQSSSMLYTRDLTVAAMDYYTDYFKIDYPLPKLDLIAIPDFISGAMENWGLITFRETSVLITEGSSSYNDYVQVTMTVCHELAHMWFGDIVTMSWWDDLWLNEGFATFMAAKCGQRLKPEYNPMLKELIRSVHPVLVRDSALTSHPIIQKVSHPDQITEIFDVISYDKGSAVLKMLEDLSPSSFREALTAYLKHYKYGNARTEDLWSSIQEVMANMDVSGVMGTWTKQAGYPLVNITRRGNNLVLTQERFLAQKGTNYSDEESPYKFKWDIPIVYFTSQDPRRIENQLFERNQDKVVLSLPSNATWYKLNWKQVGFYRVNYPRECWLQLVELLKQSPETLPWVEDKANLLEDSFQLARAGYLSYDIPLSLVGYLSATEENHFIPWTVAGKNIGDLKKILQDTKVREPFIEFARGIVEQSISDSSWDLNNKTPYPEMLRKVAQLKLALDLELPSAVEKARELLQDWLDGDAEKPFIEIRTLVYNYGISGDKEKAKWDKMWQLYLDETNPQELSKLRTALGYAKDPQLLKRFLELAKNENYVRSQDYLLLLILVSFQPEGNTVVWNFVRDEWEYLVKRFTLNDRILGRLIPSIVREYSTDEKLNEVKSFFSKYPEAGAGASGRRNAIESIENNIKWVKDHIDEIETWLRQQKLDRTAAKQ